MLIHICSVVFITTKEKAAAVAAALSSSDNVVVTGHLLVSLCSPLDLEVRLGRCPVGKTSSSVSVLPMFLPSSRWPCLASFSFRFPFFLKFLLSPAKLQKSIDFSKHFPIFLHNMYLHFLVILAWLYSMLSLSPLASFCWASPLVGGVFGVRAVNLY